MSRLTHKALGCQALTWLLAALTQLTTCSGIPLPTSGNVIAAYANWGECDEKMIDAARNGANVLIWFAINLEGVESNVSGKLEPQVRSGPNLTCVAGVKATLQDEELPTTHLISIGGWDAPHPDTRWTGTEWFVAFDTWNQRNGSRLFDGFDWDLEGNDVAGSQWNEFTVACLDLIGQMSEAAMDAGYNVTVCPPQSYLDPTTSNFSRSLRWPPVAPWHQDFHYHSRNSYTYLLAHYGRAFCLVSVQLYEGWSAANFDITQRNVSAASYLASWAESLFHGWTVDFAQDPDVALQPQRIAVRPDQLIIGLSNGANPPPAKVLLLWADDLEAAWRTLEGAGKPVPRGAMFWNAKNEGRVPEGSSKQLRLAHDLNSFLHVRQGEVFWQ